MIKICNTLTEEVLNDFCKKYNCVVSEFKLNSNNKSFYLRMFTGFYGPQPEFSVTDETCVGINTYANYDLTEDWCKFIKQLKHENPASYHFD